MTNEELIRAYFKERVKGNEESYGFSIKPFLGECVGTFALYSKTSHFPMAVKPPKNYFVVTVPYARYQAGGNGGNWEEHIALTTKIVKQLGIEFVSSPHADQINFHRYIEEKINENLSVLANDLRTGSYISVSRSTEVDPYEPKYALVSESELIYSVPENYQKLMENIHTLLEGERILGLPKNQVALLDTDEVQSLWRWLIKENPDEKDRVLLTKMYTLSRLLAPHRKNRLIMMSTPR